jgi:hypothetical protein
VDEPDHDVGSFVAEFEPPHAAINAYYYNLRVGHRVTTRAL